MTVDYNLRDNNGVVYTPEMCHELMEERNFDKLRELGYTSRLSKSPVRYDRDTQTVKFIVEWQAPIIVSLTLPIDQEVMNEMG